MIFTNISGIEDSKKTCSWSALF